MAGRTYYDILGVNSSADQKAIRQAYLQLSLKHHPDKNPQDVEGAKARFVEIGQAYATLSNPSLRADYDRGLSAGRAGTGAYNSSTVAPSYESFRDAFDATVAGMSQEEFCAAMGIVSIIGSVVGSIVGSKLASGTGGKFMGTVGSLAGSMVASQMAGDAFRSLHQESVQRVAYKEECRQRVQRGEAMPEPPRKSMWQEALERAMDAFKEPAVSNQSSSSSSTASNRRDSTQTRTTNWHGKLKEQMDAAQNRAAAAAASRVAAAMWENAKQEMQKPSSSGHQNQRF